MHISKRYTLPLVIILAAMQTVCCNKDGGDDKVPMSIKPVCVTTKATHAISGTTLPDDYVIWASAYVNQSEGILEPGDYFKSRKFVKAEGKTYWEPEGSLYWPLGASLDFLTIAVHPDAIDFEDNIGWNIRNCSKGAALVVDDDLCHDTEILYSSASSLTVTAGSIPMAFKHSQAWLCFEMKCNVDDYIVLDSIVIEDSYGGGKLEVGGSVDPVTGDLRCEWNIKEFHSKDICVPLPGSEEERTLSTTAKVFDILLPCQDRGNISFYVHMSTGPAAPYRYIEQFATHKWLDGNKYTYKVNCNLSQISIGEVSVTDWGGNIIHDMDL